MCVSAICLHFLPHSFLLSWEVSPYDFTVSNSYDSLNWGSNFKSSVFIHDVPPAWAAVHHLEYLVHLYTYTARLNSDLLFYPLIFHDPHYLFVSRFIWHSSEPLRNSLKALFTLYFLLLYLLHCLFCFVLSLSIPKPTIKLSSNNILFSWQCLYLTQCWVPHPSSGKVWRTNFYNLLVCMDTNSWVLHSAKTLKLPSNPKWNMLLI